MVSSILISHIFGFMRHPNRPARILRDGYEANWMDRQAVSQADSLTEKLKKKNINNKTWLDELLSIALFGPWILS